MPYMVAELPKKPPEPIHWHGEPERKCGNCQHWRRLETERHMGNCHNLISNLARTRETSNCARGWYPDVERFPIHKQFGVDQQEAYIASQTAIIAQNSASATSSETVLSMGDPPVGKPKPASKRSRKS